MSSLKDLASLIMVPSLVKDGRLDTVKPLGNSIIHPDATGNNDGTDGSTPAEGNFTFSRGSNLAATRVDVNGLIEKGRENLLLQSNQFDTTWGKPNSTLTQGFSGYDGSNNAWKWASTAAGTAQLSQGTSGVSGMRTLSIYAKAGSRDVFSIWVGTGIDYNLTTGQTAGHANASMESVGNGWWRCSYFNDYGTLNPYYGASSAGEFIYIMNAQAEQGLVATDYIETGASTAQAGILEDLPRLDYSGGASCPALLLEPQRTNFINHSEYIAAGVTWSAASGMTSQNNSVVSPEGVQNATKLIRPNSTGAAWVREGNISATIGLNQVVSVFAKSGSNNILNITYYDQTAGDLFFNYDLSNGTIYSAPTSSAYYVDAGIEDYGNGWYRCYAIAEAGRVDPQFQLSVGVNRGGAANSYLYVYGASHEKDVSYPTSYIPTMGSAVTRSKDNMTTDFSSALATNGSATIFFHDLGLSDSSDINTSAGSYRYQKDSANYVSLTTNDTAWRVRVQGGGVSNFRGLNDHLKTEPIKVAIVVSSTHFSIFANGVKEIDNEALSATSDFSEIAKFQTNIIDSLGAKKTLQHLVFPTALTDSECIALTTL
jgi:hypothetical protein